MIATGNLILVILSYARLPLFAVGGSQFTFYGDVKICKYRKNHEYKCQNLKCVHFTYLLSVSEKAITRLSLRCSELTIDILTYQIGLDKCSLSV